MKLGNRKKTWIRVFVVLFIILAVGFVGTDYVSGMIREELEKALGENSTYTEIDVDLFRQNIHLKELDFQRRGTRIQTPELSFKGLSYFQYLKNGKIVLDEVHLKAPGIIITPREDTVQKEKRPFQKEIKVGLFRTGNGSLQLKENDSAGNKLFLRFPRLEVTGIKVDSSTVDNTLPFAYNEYRFTGDSLRINITPEHYIAARQLEIENGKTDVHNFEIIPYYGPSTFDQKIPYEKDRISLKVNHINLDRLNFGFQNDTLTLKNSLVHISGADLQVYHNKTLPDDPRKKPLYSKMLRQSPVKLDFKKVTIDSTRIVYEEKVKPERSVSRISFNGVNGTVSNLTNMGLGQENFPRTKVEASASFMNTTPVQIDWNFDMTDPNDTFYFSGSFGSITGDTMNAFLRPSMGLAAEGKINSVAFTFTGNETVLTGDVKVKYENFRVEVLKDDGRKKSKFLSAIANFFVDNDGLSEENNVKDIKVERDQTRSFWNYVWLGVKQGVLDALVQIR